MSYSNWSQSRPATAANSAETTKAITYSAATAKANAEMDLNSLHKMIQTNRAENHIAEMGLNSLRKMASSHYARAGNKNNKDAIDNRFRWIPQGRPGQYYSGYTNNLAGRRKRNRDAIANNDAIAIDYRFRWSPRGSLQRYYSGYTTEMEEEEEKKKKVVG